MHIVRPTAPVTEGLVILREQSQDGEFYLLARDLVGTGAVALWSIWRFTHTFADVAPAAARQWEATEDHFQMELREAESFPNRLEQVEIHRFHAMMLEDRATPRDREKARTLSATR